MSNAGMRDAPLTFRSDLGQGHQERHSDTLNLLPFAESLAEFIHGCSTPMTIGIQGDWGSGKTTLLNMLRGAEGDDASGLLDNTLCQVINFETWPYSQFYQGNGLVLAYMQAVVRKIRSALADEAGIDADDLQNAFAAAEARLLEVQRHIAGPRGEGEDPAADVSALMLRFRDEFATLVRHWAEPDSHRRVVVFVDDLDRVRPAEALLLLEAIKNFLDVPGCVFVLAMDFDVVQQGMAELLGVPAQRTRGKALYDKIIQLPFVMPVASYNLQGFIAGLVAQSDLPYAADLLNSPQDLEYLHGIALCTVGRNPRNIKRVMGYTGLLLRIHERRSSTPPTRRDVQILFALVCMQIAWPELFRHFVNDPTVDTVTSLQNWSVLDRLPEMARLFQREPDMERVKINIATFFDTLFSLLDQNGDGQIDQAELTPVLEVMSQTCLTGSELRERPRDQFLRRVQENNTTHDPLVETFLDKVFTKSIWYLGSECRYRLSGNRYVTIVYQGRQIGSLVTLRNQPFVFRLAMAPERILSGLKAYWKSKHEVRTEAITFTRSVFGKEASMTGFGDTVVDYSHMTNMPAKDAIALLNALFRVVSGDEVPEWELDRDEPKKK